MITHCKSCGKELDEDTINLGIWYCSEYCTHYLDLTGPGGPYSFPKERETIV